MYILEGRAMNGIHQLLSHDNKKKKKKKIEKSKRTNCNSHFFGSYMPLNTR